MKKVLATTMATLLFGLSFPVNTFALPNNQSVTINQNSNMQLIQNPQNGQHLGSVINSESVNNVKPQGYFAVTFKVDGSKGTLTIGSQETNKSELIYYVDPNANVKLKDVGNIGAKVKDSTKYEIDKDSPWSITPTNFNKDSEITKDIELTANIKDIKNQAPNQANTYAEKLKNGLYAVDISVWKDDAINWKDGVELDTSVTDPDLKKAFNEANFEGDGRDSKTPNLNKDSENSGVKGKIKVTFKDNSYIDVVEQKLYVSSHVTAGIFDKVPKDAIKTTLFLGEGTKVIEGNVITEGKEEQKPVYRTYKVRPGTDLSKYILPTNKSVIENINLQPLNDSYINPHWNTNNFIVSDNNKEFTAIATKRYKVTFEFKGIDLDKGNNDIDENSFPKVLKDKMPEEAWVEKGKNFDHTKPENFTEIIKDDSGQVTKVYDWVFTGWNPTRIVGASEDKKLVGTWKRAQATSAEPTVEKITESDKLIKGQGQAGAKIKVTLKDNTSLGTIVGQDKNWKVEIKKDLKKDDKVSVTQIEMGKKESKVVDTIVSKKAKESKKPDINPMPNPGVKPDNKPLPKPDKKDKAKDQNKENQRESNHFGLKFKNHTSKATRVKTQVENKNLSNKQRDEARYIIDIMSGNYQVIKDGVRQNIKMDVKPLIKNDRLMLPLRSLAEMIGAKVEWDPQTRTAIFTNKGIVAKIQIDGNEIVLSNGKVIKMDSKPLNINGRILLPISNVANVFGLTNGNTKDGIDQNIEWDGDNKTVEINLNK